jgi:hypothetical protein
MCKKELTYCVKSWIDGCRDKGWMKLMDEFELGVGGGIFLQNFIKKT